MPRDERASDEELMLAYRHGSVPAFEELYRRHKASLYRYMVRQCGDRAAADELFQDVWANIIRARSNYTVEARFSTYLYRIAHNRVIDHYRRCTPALLVSFDDEACEAGDWVADPTAKPEDAYAAKERAARLLQLLDALPAAQREAFVLQHEAGMTLDEIARVTQVSRETAKSRLRYAMMKLREGMRGWL